MRTSVAKTGTARAARETPRGPVAAFRRVIALSGTATAFLGHALVAAFTRAFDSQRAGFVSLIILLLAGLAVMFRVREERAADFVD